MSEPTSDNDRCYVCDIGDLAPRTGPGRVWSLLGVDYLLPDSLAVTQCDNPLCKAMSPSASELEAIGKWLRTEHGTLNPRTSLYSGRILGYAKGVDDPFANFEIPWPRPRSSSKKQADISPSVVNRRLEHVVHGTAHPIVTMRDSEGERWIGVQVDRACGAVRWLFFKVTKYEWRSLLEHVETLSSVFDAYESDIQVIDYGVDAKPLKVMVFTGESLKQGLFNVGEILPEERETLRQTIAPIDSERAVIFDGPKVSSHSIGGYSLLHGLRAFMRPLQNLFGTKQEPQLVPFMGSFGLKVVGDSSSFDETWNQIAGLVEAAQDPTLLARVIAADPLRGDMLASFLDDLRKSSLEVYVTTPSRKFHMGPSSAKKVQKRVEEARDMDRGPTQTFVGYFLAFNVTNNHPAYTLQCTEEGRLVGGSIPPDVRARYQSGALRIVFTPTAIYEVEATRISQDERRGWLLRDARILKPAISDVSSNDVGEE